jgi:uncharacterized protein
MIEIGRYNDLRVVKVKDIGVFLDGDEYGEILMPVRYVPEGTQPDDILHAFIYRDSEDLIIATTLEPKAEVGDIAWLECKQVTDFGAFMDWGLPKDLLVPFREQSIPMEEGKSYWVMVYLDKASQRIVGSARLGKYLKNEELTVNEGDEVEIGICEKTDLGYRVMVNGLHWGILYKNEVYQPLKMGDRMRGFVKKIREDNKIDISLQKQGYEAIPELSLKLLHILKEHQGFLPLTDHSAPEEIYRLLQMSKKTFKKAVGALYKQKIVEIGEKGITLTK